jgi:hypothetical protein
LRTLGLVANVFIQLKGIRHVSVSQVTAALAWTMMRCNAFYRPPTPGS